MKSETRTKISEIVDAALSAILLVDHEWSDPKSNAKFGVHAANGALANLWGADFHLISEKQNAVWALLDNAADYYLLAKDGAEAASLAWPIDIGTVVLDGILRSGSSEVPAVSFKRLSTIEPRDVRGLVSLVPPKILALSSASIVGNEHHADLEILGLISRKWTKLPLIDQTIARGDHFFSLNVSGGSDNATLDKQVMLAYGINLTARYEWHVALGFSENGPRVLLPTSPTGAMALLRDRELESGQSRRQAVRHWVGEHWRDNSRDDDALIYVCQHLRGHTEFIWKGLFAEVLVSEFDLERNEKFKYEAALWRSQRRHNRPRLRLKSWHPDRPRGAPAERWY